jgi:DNA-binding NarL/FixJ family response regulator
MCDARPTAAWRVMVSLPAPHCDSVLIVKGDQLCAEMIRRIARTVFPDADIATFTSLRPAARVLRERKVALLIVGAGPSLEGDTLDFLANCTAGLNGAKQILVVTAHCENRVLAELRKLSIAGVFDSRCEGPGRLKGVLRTIADGRGYWSPTFLERLSRYHLGPQAVFCQLTAFEQIVLAILGGGSDDATAAEELGISVETVATVRRDLHRKLGVQHRGELMRLAAQNGFVRFTAGGVMRPGLMALSSRYYSQRRKRAGTPLFLQRNREPAMDHEETFAG